MTPFTMSPGERRHDRPDARTAALQRLLDACRARAELEAVVVADHEGQLVASAAAPGVDVRGIAEQLPTARWSFVMPELRARTLYCDGHPLFIGAIGGGDVAGIELSRAAAGAHRIFAELPLAA